MKNSLQRSILKTLVYADVFDYPLTFDQIWRFLISNKKVEKEKLREKMKSFSKWVSFENGFYCLKKRTLIIQKKRNKYFYNEKKIKIARKISSYIKFFPTILLIGISGGLAMRNAKNNDDIDFFIITKKNTIWITRFILIIFLGILGVRRKRADIKVSNKVCLNMFMDETALKLPKNKQNLYTAHEVLQMQPIFEKKDIYNFFLAANIWTKKFLPNGINDTIVLRKNKKNNEKKLADILFLFFEILAKRVQLWYMKKNRTTEIVSDKFLAFHPFDYKNKILTLYKERLNQYRI